MYWEPRETPRIDIIATNGNDGLHYEESTINPTHYHGAIEPSEFIIRNNLGWREGNVVKYVFRHRNKGKAEDIKKAIRYLEMILEEYNEAEKE